ncbi:ParA family protein [Chryseobacterium sp. SSA4.19]|uniref:ParA family protein n=1 Tax=Chryseobacterium sp. SSA4.19 TaxID=2919915 RepID=UPI001F4D8A0F|nr:ParA family protein [Chryseobacterium sp. SSA4.19]MCJ8153898.1 ParA family protein [Chryseobacterium sp. SSA4.19]
MSLINSYAIWNNKGGVGKSTITFHLASRYAELNPNINVLVIDLCPQANSSMMLLGGGTQGEQQVINYCSQTTPTTVVGYLSNVISNGSGAPLPDPNNYLVKVSTVNNNMPENIFLLSGDGNLEPMAPAISDAASARSLTPSAQPWVWIHNIFRNLIDDIVSNQTDTDWMVFVDTNPSFGIYTELAICAVNRIISPVNADDSSRTAANAMAILLHGTNPPHPIYGTWTFAAQAINYRIQIPKIHLIIGNRLTQYSGASAAFGALSDATANTLYSLYNSNSNYFTSRTNAPSNLDDFRQEYSIPLRDFNTAGVVSAHLGKNLSSMTQGYYPVHGNQVKVNAQPVSDCLHAIDAVINLL